MNSSGSRAQVAPEVTRSAEALGLRGMEPQPPSDRSQGQEADLDYSTADEGNGMDVGTGKRARIRALLRDAGVVTSATMRGRAFVQSVSQVVLRESTPPGSSFLSEEEALRESSLERQLSLDEDDGRERTDAEKIVLLREEIERLRRDRDHQSEQRKVLQQSLASERVRNESLAKQNDELGKAAEERLKGHQSVSNVEISELSAQVKALLIIKRQLYDRMQAVEAERNTLLFEKEDGHGRTCVACLDHLANTVLLKCRHLVCCNNCSKRLTHCPICRQPVRDRLTVFMA